MRGRVREGLLSLDKAVDHLLQRDVGRVRGNALAAVRACVALHLVQVGAEALGAEGVPAWKEQHRLPCLREGEGRNWDRGG